VQDLGRVRGLSAPWTRSGSRRSCSTNYGSR
jgi:hypothetical protein